MCLQVTERYAVCKCLYYKHAVDPCGNRAQRGHGIQEKTVLVGFACPSHSKGRSSGLGINRQHSCTFDLQLHPGGGISSSGWSPTF